MRSDPAVLRAALRSALRVAMSMVVANLIGAVVIFVYLNELSPTPPSAPPRDDLLMPNIITFAAYMVVSLGTGTILSINAARGTVKWVIVGRPATPDEQTRVLEQPRRQSAISAIMWLIAAPLFAGLNLALGVTGIEAERIFLAILLGGLTTTAITYLLVERNLRPIVALALAGASARDRRGLGVLPRLLLSWLLGSAVPLAGVAMAQIGRTPQERAELAQATWFLAAVGLVVGAFVTVIAAYSVSDPVNRVRDALARVQDGDVDVEVAVDDGSEIGQLQTGFNAMVAGLRDRQLLRDLFGRYVGEDVARRALDSGGAFGATQADASVLFVDLIGSTRLAHERTPDEVVTVLNALFGAVVGVVTKHGGWVNKFDGDGALAVFGAPGDGADHATCALGAARALRDSVRDLAADVPRLDVGIGVSCGRVVAGNVGAEHRYEYTVIGDPVNEAARLTTEAKQRPGRLLASAAAVAAASAGERTYWTEASEIQLRGRAAPTVSYEPTNR